MIKHTELFKVQQNLIGDFLKQLINIMIRNGYSNLNLDQLTELRHKILTDPEGDFIE